jgi:hypothetical protein
MRKVRARAEVSRAYFLETAALTQIRAYEYARAKGN